MRSDKPRLDLSRFLNEAPGDDVRDPEDASAAVFLADCAEEDWERILRHCEVRSFRRGEDVVRDGEHDRALLILTKGTLEFVSREHTFNVVTAPSLVGEVRCAWGSSLALRLGMTANSRCRSGSGRVP